MSQPIPNDAESVKLLDSVPADELPREKLFLKGRRALSDEELIAIFLRTGMQGCNVLQLAAQVKKAGGSLAELGQMEAEDIRCLVKGIGKAKAATLAAGFDLGQRAARALMPLVWSSRSDSQLSNRARDGALSFQSHPLERRLLPIPHRYKLPFPHQFLNLFPGSNALVAGFPLLQNDLFQIEIVFKQPHVLV